MTSGKDPAPCMPVFVFSFGMECPVYSESRTVSLRDKTAHFVLLRSCAAFFTEVHTEPFALYTATSILTPGLCRSIDPHDSIPYSHWDIWELLDSQNIPRRPWWARSFASGLSVEPPPSTNVALFSLCHFEHPISWKQSSWKTQPLTGMPREANHYPHFSWITLCL